MTPLEIVAALLLALGCFVALTAAVGVLRMPDFYTRLHPAGKGDTLGQMLVLAGMGVLVVATPEYSWQILLKLGLVSLFLLITTPSSTHAIAHAAHIDGRVPWQRPDAGAESPEGQA